MDPRSAAPELVDDPTGALAALGETARTEFPHLMRARKYTSERITSLRTAVEDLDRTPDLSVVLFGSWARAEYTPGSDNDWAIVTDGVPLQDSSVLDAHARAEKMLGVEGRRPGKQDLFGVPFSCQELVQHIGLEEDTNANLTRRMLLLLESVGVSGNAHERCFGRVLDAYLAGRVRSHRPPRFLLNDLVRYWRTICVDFEGKHRAPGAADDSKWVSRNAKLRTSRKVLFAGGLLPVLLCHIKESGEIARFLHVQFQASATDRLAWAFLSQSAVPEGARTLSAYDRWMEIMQDPNARETLLNLRAETRNSSALFGEIRDIGNDLDRGLLALLFETDLSPLARKYGIF